jgi:hypothetical protein
VEEGRVSGHSLFRIAVALGNQCIDVSVAAFGCIEDYVVISPVFKKRASFPSSAVNRLRFPWPSPLKGGGLLTATSRSAGQ